MEQIGAEPCPSLGRWVVLLDEDGNRRMVLGDEDGGARHNKTRSWVEMGAEMEKIVVRKRAKNKRSPHPSSIPAWRIMGGW